MLLERLREDGWEGDYETMPIRLTIGDEFVDSASMILYGSEYGCAAEIYSMINVNGGTKVEKLFSGVILDEVFLDDLYESLMLDISPDEEEEEKIKFDPRKN